MTIMTTGNCQTISIISTKIWFLRNCVFGMFEKSRRLQTCGFVKNNLTGLCEMLNNVKLFPKTVKNLRLKSVIVSSYKRFSCKNTILNLSKSLTEENFDLELVP